MRGIFLLCFAVLLLFPAGAGAWVRSRVGGDGACLHWEGRTLPWTLNDQGAAGLPLDDLGAALRRAFSTWQAVECSDFAFDERAPTPDDQVGAARGEVLVVFRDAACEEVAPGDDPCWRDGGCANAWDCWDFDPGAIAVTSTTFDTGDGRLLDADVEFNDGAFRFTTADGRPCRSESETGCVATDVENTMAHEIGHVIGLDENPALPGVTMFPSSRFGETSKRSLADDDREALCTIYPAGGPTLECAAEAPEGGCSCGSGEGLSLLAWLAAGGALLGRRTRRARG